MANMGNNPLEDENKRALKEAKQFADCFNGKDKDCAANKLSVYLKSLHNATLNIAVIGRSGSGKSSFVNAIRGLRDDDIAAAETGEVEKEVKDIRGFVNPKNPNVTLWDLPGTGTLNYKPETYLQDVNVTRYDFFIIISADRFTIHDANLAKAIKDMGKKFYFVRSKIDRDLDAAKRKKNYNEKEKLLEMKKDCEKNLNDVGIKSTEVFLISSWEFENFDFQKLEKGIRHNLTKEKQYAFLNSLPNISFFIIEKKKKAMQEEVWKVASVCCAIAAIPVPGLSIICDQVYLTSKIEEYQKHFGFDDESLTRLAEQIETSLPDLKSEMVSPLSQVITGKLVSDLLTRQSNSKYITFSNVMKCVPLIGFAVTAYPSYHIISGMLHSILGEAEKDAKRLVERFIKIKRVEVKLD